MKVKSSYIAAVLFFLILAVANCGRDTVAPSDPGSTSDIAPVLFFNSSPGAQVLLQGTASDSTKVAEVSVAINGTNFSAATIDPPGGAQTVEWTYMADAADLPAGANTILVKAVDSSDNETISSPIVVESTSGSTTGELLAVLTNPSLADTIGLSSGSGDAYGDNATSWTIPVDAGLALSGAGTATVLEADISHSALFSVSADLSLKNLAVRGSQAGIKVSDQAASDPEVLIEGCSFDGQGAWALDAVDGDAGTYIQFLSSTVDASVAASPSRGGLYLEGVTYFVSDSSEFFGHTDPGGPDNGTETGAAIQVTGGSGQITESIFTGNALAIWASGGSPLITSCDVLGAAANTSYGINITGAGGTATVRRNTVDGNTGYGVRIGGTMALVLQWNAITDNLLSGVLIDSQLSNSNLLDVDLGTGTGSEQGRNLFQNNTHPDGNGSYDTQVYVTQATDHVGGVSIPANGNYWDYFNLFDIGQSIVDGPDSGGLRASVAIGGFYTSTGQVGP
jgi:hypothetical protein